MLLALPLEGHGAEFIAGCEVCVCAPQYSASVAKVVSDTNLIPVNSTWHFPLENVVYWGMDWLCPAYNLVSARYAPACLGARH